MNLYHNNQSQTHMSALLDSLYQSIKGESDNVTAEIDNHRIDALALAYSRTFRDEVFEALFKELIPVIHHEASKYARRTGIEKTEFISKFNLAVWLAVRGDALRLFNGTTNVMQRVHHFIRCGAIDLIRHKKRKDRDKFSHVYLDAPLDDDSAKTYMPLLRSADSVESVAVDLPHLHEKLASFQGAGKRDVKIIEMLANGATLEEVAVEIGFDSYDNPSARKAVERARARFKSHLQTDKN